MRTEIAYIGPKLVYCKQYTIGLERLADMREELEKLHTDHFYETETRYLNETLEPDYAYAHHMEATGRALFFTVRDTSAENVMVGNAMFFIGPCLHMRSKQQATEDTFFLAKGHRDQGLAAALLRFIKESLTLFGIDYVWMSDKSPSGGKSLSRLFEGHGFKPVAVLYLAALSGSKGD
jgi:GNAT superfamily N-acetyltransferase